MTSTTVLVIRAEQEQAFIPYYALILHDWVLGNATLTEVSN